jgi:hypothetical protein
VINSMSAVIRLLLRTTDLVEAQGRSLRRVVTEIALSFAIMLAAAGLGLVACTTAAASLTLALASVMPLAAALALVAGVVGIATLIAGFVAVRLSNARR